MLFKITNERIFHSGFCMKRFLPVRSTATFWLRAWANSVGIHQYVVEHILHLVLRKGNRNHRERETELNRLFEANRTVSHPFRPLSGHQSLSPIMSMSSHSAHSALPKAQTSFGDFRRQSHAPLTARHFARNSSMLSSCSIRLRR